MMNNYTPFLKLKSNEIQSVKELDVAVKKKLRIFFDFPRRKNSTVTDFRNAAARMSRSVERNLPEVDYFYLDNFDIDSRFAVDGAHNYAFLLELFRNLPIVPTVSIDRCAEHIQSVVNAKDEGWIQLDAVALRLVAEDFEDYDASEDEIRSQLGGLFDKFSAIHLVLDCRMCVTQDARLLANRICDFTERFVKSYPTTKVIVAGSSIPSSINEILAVDEESEWERTELQVYSLVVEKLTGISSLSLGDYGTVSPNYSDIDMRPEALLNIIVPKIIYTFGSSHYCVRGEGSIRNHPRGYYQYYDLAAILVAKSFFRGSGYSFGDTFFDQKSRSEGSNVTPGSIIKPSVNAHITYMISDYAVSAVS